MRNRQRSCRTLETQEADPRHRAPTALPDPLCVVLAIPDASPAPCLWVGPAKLADVSGSQRLRESIITGPSRFPRQQCTALAEGPGRAGPAALERLRLRPAALCCRKGGRRRRRPAHCARLHGSTRRDGALNIVTARVAAA